ncbi:MAG: thioredoxin-dependent thiol peroxidase [Clostridia bacterium]|nr:thioredoxin-dependent thiol peroxidase [Clostridia bacterium]
MLKVGDKVKDFTLTGDDGNEVSLSSFRGKKVVIYFYPKDNTPGCTKEACSFRDAYDDILENGAVVLGISKDSVKSHQKFKGAFKLPFYLLSDPDNKVIEDFGAWQEKSMYGKTYMGIVRSTYIIDEKGFVSKVFPKVSPDEHGKEIVSALKG